MAVSRSAGGVINCESAAPAPSNKRLNLNMVSYMQAYDDKAGENLEIFKYPQDRRFGMERVRSARGTCRRLDQWGMCIIIW